VALRGARHAALPPAPAALARGARLVSIRSLQSGMSSPASRTRLLKLHERILGGDGG
jgi:hypothetical protein